jgi:hypothetical protein
MSSTGCKPNCATKSYPIVFPPLLRYSRHWLEVNWCSSGKFFLLQTSSEVDTYDWTSLLDSSGWRNAPFELNLTTVICLCSNGIVLMWTNASVVRTLFWPKSFCYISGAKTALPHGWCLQFDFWCALSSLILEQADRAYGTEISPRLFVISFVILLYAILYNICI